MASLTNSRLRKELRKVKQPQTGWLDVFPAVIGKADGTVKTGTTGEIYVRNVLNGQVLRVFNLAAPNIVNLQVEVGRRVEQPNLWQVKGVRETFNMPAGSGKVPYHAEQHQFPGPDTVWVDRKQVLPLTILVSDGAGFIVRVFGNMSQTPTGNLLIDTQDIDLSSYVPTQGAKYISLECDENGAITVQDGTAVGAMELLTEADIPVSAPDKYFLGYVLLFEAQAELANDHVRVAFPPGVIGRGKAGDVLLERLGSTATRDLQHMQNVIHSTGWISGGLVTDNGDGTIAVATGTGVIRATDDNTDVLYFTDWAADTSISLTDDSINYIYIDYNAGTPIPVASTTEPTEYQTKIMLARIFRNGTELHINQTVRHTIGDHAGLMMRAMAETMPFAWVSGAEISEVGTRQFSITEGIWWNGLTRFVTAEFDGTSDTFNMYYRDGVGGWTEVAGETAINNTQYDDGDGTLGTLTANRYGVHWVFIATDDDVHCVLGQGDYTLAQAQAAQVPASLPPELLVDSRLAAKIIIQKSASTFTSLESFIGMDSSSPSSSGYTDEEAQDAVGAMVDDVTIKYIDSTPLLFRGALTGDVTASAGSPATNIENQNLRDIMNSTAAEDDILQYKSGTWVERTLTQLWTDLKAIVGLSMEGRHYLPFGVYANVSPMSTSPADPYATSIDRDFTCKSISFSFVVLTTNDGTHYWRLQLRKIGSAGSVLLKELNTSAGTAGVWQHIASTSFVVDAVTTSHEAVYVECIKQGSPGNLYLAGPALEISIP